MATADEEAMEGCRGGFGVDEATGPVGTVSVGGEGHGRRFVFFARHESRVRGSRKRTGEDEEGEEGGPGPP